MKKPVIGVGALYLCFNAFYVIWRLLNDVYGVSVFSEYFYVLGVVVVEVFL